MRLMVTRGRVLRRAAGLLTLIALPAVAQEHANKANWALADQFSTANLRSRLYATSVNPYWLGQSDSLCYDWKDHGGSAFYIVVPTTKTKKLLFDQQKMASQLSDLSHHAHDPQNLPFTSIIFSKDRKTFTFTADSSKWEWNVAAETLTRLGPSNPAGAALPQRVVVAAAAEDEAATSGTTRRTAARSTLRARTICTS